MSFFRIWRVSLRIISDKLNFPLLYFNTIVVNVLMIIGQLLIEPLRVRVRRLRFPGKNLLFLFMLALMMVPGRSSSFRGLSQVKFGLTDTLIGSFSRASTSSGFFDAAVLFHDSEGAGRGGAH